MLQNTMALAQSVFKPSWPLKLGGLVLALAGGLWAAHGAGFFEPGFATQLQAQLQGLGPWAPAWFFCLKVLTVIFALPSAPVTIAGGVIFGFWAGLFLNISAATGGAALTFWLSRRLGRVEIEKRLRGRLHALDAQLSTHGLWAMLFLRLVPLFPFNAINYGAGLTGISFRAYVLGTLIGITPGAAVFTGLGVAAHEASWSKAGLALGALGLLALLPIWLCPHRARRRPAATLDEPRP
jgi:uncharacterized membrane protein YdjX (TVP38/TMEM64 family)